MLSEEADKEEDGEGGKEQGRKEWGRRKSNNPTLARWGMMPNTCFIGSLYFPAITSRKEISIFGFSIIVCSLGYTHILGGRIQIARQNNLSLG